ncbi:unnamed protein product [Rotaria magnacalcarata]|uniref:Protein NO VEIN C-terminal domain-containing protein n=1 Tax=Rotaria magnacalcarata TaxID=392030 RepID=A0A816LZQ7_9BILA|nr:unnamed protein product [Rotaria magnacalcarata]
MKLFALFQKGTIGKEELSQLNTLKLLTTHGTLIPAERCYFSNSYDPRLPLEEYLKTVEDMFLSPNYLRNSIFCTGKEDLDEKRRFFSFMGVRENLFLIKCDTILATDKALQYGFCSNYLLTYSPNGRRMANAYSGLRTISFLQHTIGNFKFARIFWSTVLKNFNPHDLRQETRVFWHSNHGTPLPDYDYVKWLIENTKCIPTRLLTCESATETFLATKTIIELCGEYLPIAAISFTNETTGWLSFFNFRKSLLPKHYFNLLNKIRADEKSLNNNESRIQKIYGDLLESISSWSLSESEFVREQSKTLYLLSENNQWKLASELFVYVEDGGEHSSLNEAIPSLKLDFKNRNHSKLINLLELMNVKQIRMNDLILACNNSSDAIQFRTRLIEILPFMKNWLRRLEFTSEFIEIINKKIERKLKFFESDRLQLFYDSEFVQETNVYIDPVKLELYVSRPWNSETTFISLPKKLCQLLNIKGFEDNLRFLLKAPIIEIKAYFKKNGIDIPTAEDKSVLQQMTKLSLNSPPDDNLVKHLGDSLKTLSIRPTSLINKEIDDIHLFSVSSFSNSITAETMRLSERNRELRSLDLRITRLGEEIVYKYLKHKFKNYSDSVSIKWENEDKDANLPYDILLRDNKQTEFIEVQVTESNGNPYLNLSIRQIEEIFKHEQNYSIYRVYLAEQNIEILDNIRWRLKRRQRLTCRIAKTDLAVSCPVSSKVMK